MLDAYRLVYPLSEHVPPQFSYESQRGHGFSIMFGWSIISIILLLSAAAKTPAHLPTRGNADSLPNKSDEILPS